MATPVRCGELLCQRDSYARAVSTVVVSCEPRAAAAAAAPGKGKKGKGAAVPPPPLPEWEVVLGDTVLFPEGGGQPSDAGTVGGVQCSRVDNVDGLARHVLSAPLEPGTAVDVVLDWPRREDNMAQHSAQHLLTAIALRKWGYDTTSWGLGDATSFLELGTPEFTPLMMAELEAEANEAAVKAGTAATPSWHSVARAVAPSWHSVADVNEGRVPGLRKPVRVITYDGLDTNTCCGTHVHSTARLQACRERALHVHRPAADADFVKALAASLDEALAEAQGLLLA
ncbi:hypothetical protein EMIHUDRAFT_233436 [Emiliania huxleyi CCMP1516]|uniref:Threonyl/alanyl tRNA synthetase SAD domain-containing protein n=2 Tax=Emiliania huxleyi TaxID=2903 RepID=A0A0D3K281_EMIH1|nr:hypothetical protein EMIHUDRAFT_233436 [Emiliania huxleyi CCMP1516]EOD29866.1 hypothetical protein EMIHUDRAFT_233436 [Emiliania huxleyi CCMP1516]|eukprot:XP_005782295.1 hypothetical protein EMIHUDRAFT_233436 [Emiliania huxleyi CCMP1516]